MFRLLIRRAHQSRYEDSEPDVSDVSDEGEEEEGGEYDYSEEEEEEGEEGEGEGKWIPYPFASISRCHPHYTPGPIPFANEMRTRSPSP